MPLLLPPPVTTEAAKPVRKLPALRLDTLLALTVLVGGGVALRCFHLADRTLWFDEAFSWRLVQFPFQEMLERASRDANPPLYYLLLRLWAVEFGYSPLALRSLSVVLGGVAVLGMYLFAAEAFPQKGGRGRGMGLLTAALVAVSVFQVRWAWEARMYALGAALAALSSWALFRALRPGPTSRSAWALYGVFAVLFAYTHTFALFSVAAQVVFLLGHLLVSAGGNVRTALRSRQFRGALLAGAIFLAGWLPWLPILLAQRQQAQAVPWMADFHPLLILLVSMRMFARPDDALYAFPVFLLVAPVVCLVVLAALFWRPRAGAWYLIGALGIPAGLSVLLSVLDTRIFWLRYLLFAHLFLLAALALFLWRLPANGVRGILIVLALAAGLWAYADFTKSLDIAHRPGARGAAEFLTAERRAGEPVVVCSPMVYLPVLYHLQNRADVYLHQGERAPVYWEGAAVLTADDFIAHDRLRELQGPRVWVVQADGGARRTVQFPAMWVQKREVVFDDVYQGLGNVHVIEYEAPVGKP